MNCRVPRYHSPRKKDSYMLSFFRGGDSRGRTGDLLNAIQALYQLSYTPKVLNRMVEAQGLEPWTSRMWSERSNQLSYASKSFT